MHHVAVATAVCLGMSLAGTAALAAAAPAQLPPPAFTVDHTRSDLSRPVRPLGKPYKGPIADIYVHLNPKEKGSHFDLADIVEAAAKSGVRRMIVMPVPNEERMGPGGAEKRLKLREKGKKAGVDVRLFCGSDYLSVWMNDASRRPSVPQQEIAAHLDHLRADLDSGDCAGVGEIGLFHFQKWGHQPVIDYPPTFPPFLKVVGIAASKGVWLALHAEPVEPDGRSRENEVFGAVALMYARHPDLKLILSHTAMTNPTNARHLLETYPHLIFNVKLVEDHAKWRNLEPVCNENGAFYRDWAKLMEAMPDRFVVGTDVKFGRQGVTPRTYRQKIEAMRLALGSLKPEAARLIAWDNAVRLFGK